MRNTFFIALLTGAAITRCCVAQTQPSTLAALQKTNEWGIIANINLVNEPLDRAMQKLHEASGADIIIARDDDKRAPLPVIESLKLTNVTVEQTLRAMAEICPQIEVEQVKTDIVLQGQNEVYAVHVKPVANASTGKPDDRANAQTVEVYNLSQLTDPGYGPGVTHDRAADVLSLIQAVLASMDGPKPVVQFHEPTGSIIVKATSEQQNVVANTLTTLKGFNYRPPDYENMNQQQLEAYRTFHQKQLDAANARLKTLSSPATQP